jgi:hypothetical protein
MRNSRTGYLKRCGIAAAALAACLGTALPAAGATAGPDVSYGPATSSGYAGSVWGGYVARGQGFHTITGSWVEPSVQCTSYNDVYAPWVGIDGYGSRTVEQTGVETNCSNGHPAYRPWFEMYPAPPQYWNDTVRAGDHMTGNVTYQGGGYYAITLTDDTRGWSEHTRQYLGAQNVSAEAVIESPTHRYPRFSRLDFSGIQVNGQVFDAYSPGALSSGGYSPTGLSNGSFSMVPGYGSYSQRGDGVAVDAGTLRY